jgi:hypothetical protein
MILLLAKTLISLREHEKCFRVRISLEDMLTDEGWFGLANKIFL